MKIQNLDYGFPMILIDDFYNFWEVGQIWSELKELTEKDVFLDPHQSWSATRHGKLLNNNRMVIFPGFIQHQVTEVVMEEKYKNKGLGRWCMTQFLATKFTESENVESHHGGKLFSSQKSDK